MNPPPLHRLRALLSAYEARGWRIATAESCTGGMVSAALTTPPGASRVFECGFATYSNTAKIALLGVSPNTLNTHGAVSEPVAREMASGALTRSQADVAVSITGIAGPGGSDFKPEGRVCFALAQSHTQPQTLAQPHILTQPDTPTPPTTVLRSKTIEFGAPGREKVRLAALSHALNLLESALQNAPPNRTHPT